MGNTDFAFANDVRAAVELRTPRTSRMLLWSVLGLCAAGLVWAHFAVLDEVKRGNGRVIPSRQMQVVQSLEGGIIAAILVQEGSLVAEGQPLVRIEDTSFASQFGEIRERRAAMAARVIRLETEAQGRDKVYFPEELTRDAPRSVDAERSLFEARVRKLAQEGKESADKLAEEAMAGLALMTVVLTVACQLAMPWLMYVINPGYVHDPVKFRLAVILTQITMPYLPCMAIYAHLSGVLNSHGRFIRRPTLTKRQRGSVKPLKHGR